MERPNAFLRNFPVFFILICLCCCTPDDPPPLPAEIEETCLLQAANENGRIVLYEYSKTNKLLKETIFAPGMQLVRNYKYVIDGVWIVTTNNVNPADSILTIGKRVHEGHITKMLEYSYLQGQYTDSAFYAYDLQGYRTRKTDAQGRYTLYFYDEGDLVREIFYAPDSTVIDSTVYKHTDIEKTPQLSVFLSHYLGQIDEHLLDSAIHYYDGGSDTTVYQYASFRKDLLLRSSAATFGTSPPSSKQWEFEYKCQ